MRFQRRASDDRSLDCDDVLTASPGARRSLATRPDDEEERWRHDHAVIPYESLDPLTIGASGDETRSSRDTLELEIPEANLLAAIYPDEPDARRRRDRGRPRRARVAGLGAALLRAVAGSVEGLRDHRQPVPADAAVEAPARPCSTRSRPPGKPARGRLRERQGLPDVRLRHRAEDRQGQPRAHGAPRASRSTRTTRATPTTTTYVGVSSRGTPVWLHKEVAACDVKITIGQAQSNHWGAGGGGKLILPGVVSDETIESNHCAFVPSPQTHYGAYAGPMRSDIDEVATMCGLDCTMNVLLDTHGRVIECIFGSHPDAHRAAIERFNAIYAYEHPGSAGRHRDLRRLRADRPPLLPHGLGLHVGRLRRQGRRRRSSTARPRRASRRRSATSPGSR